VPDFTAAATSNKDIVLSACQGYKVVLYFYPKDATPGCTQESQDFRDLYPDFKAERTCIFGVSRDTLSSHEKFKATQELPFELIADTDEALCRLFDVIKPKNMYGKHVMGIERSTFLIDEHGVLQRQWRKVTVQNHAQIVLEAVQTLDSPHNS
ncbi:MAG: peroxiredoxin, partial [Gammaproteobacteria bacterium]